MKRFRVKVVGLRLGLGFALATGTAFAAGADWRAPGQAAPVESGMPGLLPGGMRGSKAEGPIWVPARQAPGGSVIVPAGGMIPAPDVVPSVAPVTPPPAPPPLPAPTPVPPPPPPPPPPPAPAPQPEPGAVFGPVGPRGTGVSGPLPAIPVLPDVTQSTVAVPVVPQPAIPSIPVVTPRQPDPVPPPRPIDQPPKAVDPPMMIPPRVPEYLPPKTPDPAPKPQPPTPQPLPQPKPVETPGELPTAPPELMLPAGTEVGGKHGFFGSPPIRLSRDYPPLRDLVQKGHASNDLTILDEGGDSGAFNRYFVRGEYLLWWVPSFATPVLATTNSNPGANGFLGEQGTTSLFGPGGFVGSTHSGLRLRAGAWLDDGASCGIDGGFFFLGTRSSTTMLSSDQSPLITRPVFVPNLVPGTNSPLGESGESVAAPGVLRGLVTVNGDSSLWGMDFNLRKCLLNRCDLRAEAFIGYRFLNLRESLAVTENITVIGRGNAQVGVMDPIGTQVVVQDRFATRNYFNGGQIGGIYDRRIGRWSWDARGAFSMGSTHQVLEIDGFQVRQPPGADSMFFRGGLLAAGPNLGTFTRDKFSVVPEFSLNVGYYVRPNVRLYAGYNFLLWTNVIRPGDQIDHTVDLTFVPNSPAGAPFSGMHRPRPSFTQRDLVVNGVQFGVDWRW